MQEQFVNEFMAKVTDLISDVDLNIVYKQLMIHVSEYDIRKKSTEAIRTCKYYNNNDICGGIRRKHEK